MVYERNVGIDRSADRQHAERKSDRCAAQPRLPRALPVLAAHPDEAAHRHRLEFLASVAPRLKQRLADREQADDENEHVDAVEQLRDAERETRVAGELIDPDQAERQSEKQTEESVQQRSAEQRRHGGKRHDRECEVLGRPEPQRDARQEWREERQRDGRERARHERSDRGRRQRRGAASLPGHRIAVDRGRNRCGLTRRIEQDARRRAAVHRAVIDAAEHDEGADRIEAEGDWQQQRHSECRPDSGQHADGGAERHAGECPPQVRPCQRVREPLAEQLQRVHGSDSCSTRANSTYDASEIASAATASRTG